MVLVGLLLLVVSGLSATCAVAMQCRANPDAAMPLLFGRAARVPRPWRVRTLYGLAGATGALGMASLSDALGYWAFLTIFIAWAPGFLIQYSHNRSVSLQRN